MFDDSSLIAPSFPARQDADGTWRVGETRVRLETVLTAFNQGMAAEEIVLNYPSLALEQVYATISYYLANRKAVDEFLVECRSADDRARAEIEDRFPPNGTRERLLARRKSG